MNYLVSQVAIVVKNPPANAGDIRDMGYYDPGFDPWVRKIPWGGHAIHSHILAWRIPMGRGAWRATVHRVVKSLS